MNSTATIAVSGLQAASRRLEVSASNVANARSTGALPDANGTVPPGAPKAYQPLELVQQDVTGGGTATVVKPARRDTVATSDPQAPFANQDGLVAAPAVDLAREMISQMVAKYSFAATARVLKADDQMKKTVLDILT